MALLLEVVLAGACLPRGVPDSPDELPGMRSNEHLLLVPSGAPERLLGREVRGDDEQGWTVAQERRPGCSVHPWEEAAAWKRAVREDIGRAAEASLGHQVGGLVARYGREMVVQTTVVNELTLHADLSGDCGDRVIDAVHVGVGHRSLRRKSEGGLKVEGPGTRFSPVRGGIGGHHEVEGELVWETPQAWAFSVSQVGDVSRPVVEIDAPARLASNEVVRVRVRADRRVWLIALFRTDDEDLGVLVPNERIGELVVKPGESISLPEVEAVHSGRTGDPEYEVLEIYAFAEREDYERLRPPRGALSPQDMVDYVEMLGVSLRDLPQRRWATSSLRYAISPRVHGRAE